MLKFRVSPLFFLTLGIAWLSAIAGQETPREQNRTRYFCQSHLNPSESRYLHTSLDEHYARAYRNALQDCRYFHPEAQQNCQVLCWRLY